MPEPLVTLQPVTPFLPRFVNNDQGFASCARILSTSLQSAHIGYSRAYFPDDASRTAFVMGIGPAGPAMGEVGTASYVFRELALQLLTSGVSDLSFPDGFDTTSCCGFVSSPDAISLFYAIGPHALHIPAPKVFTLSEQDSQLRIEPVLGMACMQLAERYLHRATKKPIIHTAHSANPQLVRFVGMGFGAGPAEQSIPNLGPETTLAFCFASTPKSHEHGLKNPVYAAVIRP